MHAIPDDITAGFYSDPADLSNLRLIDRASVEHSAATLQALSAHDLDDRPLVIAVGTGGTLSMKEEGGIRSPDLDFNAIFERTDPSLRERFCVLGLDAFKLDSAQMDYTHVQDIAICLCYLWKICQTHKIPLNGFLILHGTDTLSFAGAAMSLIMGQGLPFSIVYTAAQKSIQTPINDAGINIRNALYTLESLSQNEMAEVVLVMGAQALLCSAAIKVHDHHSNAFAAPIHHPIADFSSLHYPVRLAPFLNPRRRTPFKPTIWQGAYSHTLVISSYLGFDPAIVRRQVEDPHVRAVLLYSYGAGTLYDGIIDAVMAGAALKNCPVFVVSPVNTDFKVVYESAKTVVDRGAIPLYMTLPAALAKIEIALRLHGDNIDAIGRFMTVNYVGEIPNGSAEKPR